MRFRVGRHPIGATDAPIRPRFGQQTRDFQRRQHADVAPAPISAGAGDLTGLPSRRLTWNSPWENEPKRRICLGGPLRGARAGELPRGTERDLRLQPRRRPRAIDKHHKCMAPASMNRLDFQDQIEG